MAVLIKNVAIAEEIRELLENHLITQDFVFVVKTSNDRGIRRDFNYIPQFTACRITGLHQFAGKDSKSRLRNLQNLRR